MLRSRGLVHSDTVGADIQVATVQEPIGTTVRRRRKHERELLCRSVVTLIEEPSGSHIKTVSTQTLGSSRPVSVRRDTVVRCRVLTQ